MPARGPASLVSVVLALLLALPATALAQARGKRAAAAHFQKASGLYAAGRYDDALDEFKAGYEAFPLPGFLVNLGQCYRKLDRLPEATDAFKRFLESKNPDERLRGEVEEALNEVRAELDRRAETENKRKRDEDDARRALLASIAAQQKAEAPELTVHESRPSVHAELTAAAPPAQKKGRWWVWTIVGVTVAGAVVAGVTVGVIYGQPQGPQPGSLGLLDGRRP